jgi:hypothetical protein
MRFSRTALSCVHRVNGYGTYQAGRAFCARRTAPHPVAIEQPQCHVQPSPTPPLPAEALAISGAHHLAPDLLFHPVLDKGKAPTGVTLREVVHPAPQDRVDQFDPPTHRLRAETSKDLSQLAQQRRSLLELGPEVRPLLAAKGADASEVESQEAEAFAQIQFDGGALLFIDLNLQLGQFLSQP